MSEPTDPGIVSWLVDHAWAPCAALVGFVWKQNESAHKATRKHADEALRTHKEEDAKEFEALHDEQKLQRGHIGKLFDQMRDESQRSEERHRELMQRMHDGHRELFTALHTGLASKADK